MSTDSTKLLSNTNISRRALMRGGAKAVGGLALLSASGLATPGIACAYETGADTFGPLGPPDTHGLMLPPGFSSRKVATSGVAVEGTSHVWHLNPDGGVTFETGSGGWIYVSNAETVGGAGGVSAIVFDAGGTITDAYSILSGTNRNCAGGPTPWGTWLSCEEVPGGLVYECDPFAANSQGTLVAGLGTFNHEAVAVDPVNETLYLTEDQPNGLLYRFTPSSYPNLQSGMLEAAEILDPQSLGPIQPGQVRSLAWHPIVEANPAAGGIQNATHLPIEERATRFQAPAATLFNGGEGCFLRGDEVFLSTKGDNRVWSLNTTANTIEIIYDFATSSTPELMNVDNVFAAANGDVYVAEDPGDLQIVALTPSGKVKPIVQVTGQTGTEITGPALNPDGTRLYFSSQRNPGTTYEVTGPFAGLPQLPSMNPVGGGLLFGALATIAALRLRTK